MTVTSEATTAWKGSLTDGEGRPACPAEAQEWDELLVEFKNSAGITKQQFESALAALEFILPQLKGHLACISQNRGILSLASISKQLGQLFFSGTP